MNFIKPTTRHLLAIQPARTVLLLAALLLSLISAVRRILSQVER